MKINSVFETLFDHHIVIVFYEQLYWTYRFYFITKYLSKTNIADCFIEQSFIESVKSVITNTYSVKYKNKRVYTHLFK